MTQEPKRAPFACRPETSRGRLHDEPASRSRSPYQRDRDRILHCGAFRRLKHKTQVFVAHEGDYYRTRLTHSLEVAQIARSLARSLGLDEDLTEGLALAHDLGHTPFGHAGEEALGAAMAPFGGFDHNAQSLRIVTTLEERYAEFDGLNLTWETHEGLVKHNGPLLKAAGAPLEGLPEAILVHAAREDLWLHSHPSLEAQIAALADDIAYTSHDLDDGLRAGLFPLEALEGLPRIGPILEGLRGRYPGLELRRLVAEMIRRLISSMVEDLTDETRGRLAEARPQTADDVRRAGRPLAAFSPLLAEDLKRLRAFLWQNMYRHHRVIRKMSTARRVVRALFEAYLAEPDILPADWQRRRPAGEERAVARLICDFIAGMTDRFALQEHRKLTTIEDGP